VTENWRDRAACVGEPIDVFFPIPLHPGRAGHRKDYDPYATARLVCAGCPVKDECLVDAVVHESNATAHGMRGGLTPRQRRGMSRQRLTRCEVCGNHFTTWRPQARFCSPACQRKSADQRQRNVERRNKQRNERRREQGRAEYDQRRAS
jgi:hypothetical protein